MVTNQLKSQTRKNGQNNVVEKVGNLFECSPNISLAHCVSADMCMGKGIALIFKKRFGRVDKLKAQRVPVGGCAQLKLEHRCIFYLVTKERYFQKPTYEQLECSLQDMREKMKVNNVQDLAMPRIGSGLDRLNWTKVKEIIETVFKDDVKITIYSL